MATEALKAPKRITPKIAEELKPLLISISKLKPDPENARMHGTRNLQKIASSLERFGQMKPIVYRKGIIIAGSGTYIAATTLLGWTKIAAVDASALTPAQAKAFGIMDNRSAELAEWDYQQLSNILRDLDKELLDATGFEDFEIEPLLQADWNPGAPGNLEQSDDAEAMDALPHLTPEQRAIIVRAIAVRRSLSESQMERSDALTAICREFMEAHINLEAGSGDLRVEERDSGPA